MTTKRTAAVVAGHPEVQVWLIQCRRCERWVSTEDPQMRGRRLTSCTSCSDVLRIAADLHVEVEKTRAEQNTRIADAYRQGVPVVDIAAALPMSRRGVYDILRREGVAFL